MKAFTLLRGALTLLEGPAQYRPSEDSLWLAWALPSPPKRHALICDIGCGTGAVGLAYHTYHKASLPFIYGYDINPKMAYAAQKSAALNGHNSAFVTACIQHPPFLKGTFDLCMANPPFFNPTTQTQSRTNAKKEFRFTENIKTWGQCLLSLTKEGGVFGLILHKEDAPLLKESLNTQGATLFAEYTLRYSPHKAPKRTILLFKKGAHPHSTIIKTLNTFDPTLRKQVLG